MVVKVNIAFLAIINTSNFFVTIYCSSNMSFFFGVTIKKMKNKNLVHLTPLNHRVKSMVAFIRTSFFTSMNNFVFNNIDPET